MSRTFPIKQYEPSNYSAHNGQGKVVSLDQLTHDELLQVACEAIQTLEVIDCQSHSIAQLIEGWRNGDNPAMEIDMDN